ncbi:histidine kinase-, DNA gyrase B-, and HSP90-like ATPase family protein [Actinidia rufa]|uniref:Histidine kinase-, DNA gyrase B-, and HSP90-like ATPase family protein n=1 Tax=Actinidia rufa TaxID=165716 RepID=A0A7J0HDP7_9ERIC|nr:histidine kinase-, DNA gyrase B-, and HSP90-like ATPase family protein [Actinidia rufa]
MNGEDKKKAIGVEIKKEIVERTEYPESSPPSSVIDISSTDSDSKKKRKIECLLPAGFLDPIRPEQGMIIRPEQGMIIRPKASALPSQDEAASFPKAVVQSCKQFWKAGDYEGDNNSAGDFASDSVGLDHVRVHPKFLHSNATSHKWALGAFAELLDNALDEVCNGASYVRVDVLNNEKDKNKMLLVEDNGGGMTPDKMRQCMSLGYSAKSKLANTIGQYGNGFKTSTMRLGADVIVFSLCPGTNGRSPTQTIGMLSYTFLKSTGKEDIVVPMIDYKRRGQEWNKLMRSSSNDWSRNLETILHWSPYASEEDLLQQSYASILYLRIPAGFRIILRGKDVDHHSLINDMMLTKEITYRPIPIAEGMPKGPNTVAVVTLGFVKDAEYHIDIQGFNVYHKNRLIKPFWRVWNAAGSDGRGVIGVLEANFVEPAHDKQGFERTTPLARLEARLIVIQKNYWSSFCQKIGYAPRRHSKKPVSPDRESTPSDKEKSSSRSNSNGHFSDGGSKLKSTKKKKKRVPADDASEVETRSTNHERSARSHHNAFSICAGAMKKCISNGKTDHIAEHPHPKVAQTIGDEHASANSNTGSMVKIEKENHELRERLAKAEGSTFTDLLHDLQLERERCKSLEIKLQEAQQKIEEMDREHETLIDIFSEERGRRDAEEDRLRNRLKETSNTIQELLDKVKLLERRRP